MYLSWLTHNTVAKVDGDVAGGTFGEQIWYLDGQGGTLGGVDLISTDWSQVGGNDGFTDQHSVLLRHDGKLQLLDNGSGRGLVIAMDQAARTATVEATHATGSGVCGPQGTARSTAAGHAVVACTGGPIREYDAAGTMVWQATAECVGGGFVPGSGRWYPLDW